MSDQPPNDPTQPSSNPPEQPVDDAASNPTPAPQSPWDVPTSGGGAVTSAASPWGTPPTAPDNVGWASPDSSQTPPPPPTPYGSPTPPTPYGSPPPTAPTNFAPQQFSQPPTPYGQAPQQFPQQFGQQPQAAPGQFPPQQFAQQGQMPQQAWGAPPGQFPPGQFPPGQFPQQPFGAYPGFSTAPRKSKKKIVIIILVLLALLLGGCGSLIYYGYKQTLGKAVDQTNSLFSDLKAENYNAAATKFCARSQFSLRSYTLQQRTELAEDTAANELGTDTIRSYNFKNVETSGDNYTVTGTVVVGTRTRIVTVNLIDQDDSVCVVSFSAV